MGSDVRMRTARPIRPHGPRLSAALGLLAAALLFAPPAAAHDINVNTQQLARDVQRLADTLRFYQERPPLAGVSLSEAEQRRALGAAEIELGLGHTDRALSILLGRLADPAFQALPEYVDTLLMTSEILEQQAQDVGAMLYAEQALTRGGDPEQMAEAGARWFRLARRNQRNDRLVEILNLWRARGGAAAAGTELAAQVMYQVAFAVRAQGDREEARAYLARVPSESAYGSRAAYLAGVLFVEDGNLTQAERWFGAVMEWAIVAPAGAPHHALETELRDLAALSAARLRYERGDLEGAEAAYRRIQDGSPFMAEACWERAYLALEQGKHRAAEKRMQCVMDLGARGNRAVDARMFKASLLAHMEHYDRSIAKYEALHTDLAEEQAAFVAAIASLQGRPAQYMFDAMERSATAHDEAVSPGPATLFADAWTPEVDQAYRVDRGLQHAGGELGALMLDIQVIAQTLRSERAMGSLELRRRSLETLLQEIRHQEGHARQALQAMGHTHASLGAAVEHDHTEDARTLRTLIEHLQVMGSAVEAELTEADRAAERRRTEALALLGGLYQELTGIEQDLKALVSEADAPVNGVAQQALEKVQAELSDASMRAEFGVLDTFWLKKQHRTREIEGLLQLRKETERQVLDAIEDLERE
jgi:hypothetical protein